MSEIGHVLAGRYLIEGALGGGGTSLVWRAIDRQSGALVAIKQLRPQFARMAATRRRFLREAEIVRRLDHPGIVKVLDAGDDVAAGPFLALELIAGETLRQLIDRSRGIGCEPARRIGVALAEVLAHAHGRGVLHRDLKPENIFIAGPPCLGVDQLLADPGFASRIRLTDFGQARVTALASLTGASFAWGTPEYMAPEVFSRGRTDPRSDLYSLGVILYEMATGRLPWSRREVLARLGPAAAGPPLLDSGLGSWFDGVVRQLLARSPLHRPDSAREAWLRLARPDSSAEEATGTMVRCVSCGAPGDRELPVCLECGHLAARFAHSTKGPWRLLLLRLPDDVAAVGSLLDVAAAIARPLSGPLLFLTGDLDLYSKTERRAALALPAVLFRDLDQATALGLEQLFKSRGLDVKAWRRGRFSLVNRWGTAHRLQAIIATAAVGASWSFMSSVGMAALLVGGGWLGALTIWVGYEYHRLRSTSGTFTLNGTTVAVPAADALLATASASLAAVRSPEARGLLAEVVTALYRLACRLGHVQAEAGGASISGADHALAAKVVADAPALLGRVAALGQRLGITDEALAAGSEAELMQELARIERRVGKMGKSSAAASADAETERMLVQARRQVEATLDRRHQLEVERDELTTSLCDLLGQLREASREVEALLPASGTSRNPTGSPALAALAARLAQSNAVAPGDTPASSESSPDQRS
jgi:hypothetical protein